MSSPPRRRAPALALAALLSLVAGCAGPQSTRCPNGRLCPPGTACDLRYDTCFVPGQPFCGNGIVEGAEECDDDNRVDGDGCNRDCTRPRCGNGLVEPGETCDDGNNDSGDGCRADCLSDETCGNGHVDTAAGEVCDDGNQTDGDGCNARCEDERCGNGILDAGEACDDGNTVDGDGCDRTCRSNERCGNGITDQGESCDDGNLRSLDGCSSLCTSEVPLWLPRPPRGPSARFDLALAYDDARDRVVLFGGTDAVTGQPLRDTFEFDGIDWRHRRVAQAPPARAAHAMTFDANRGRVVLFGGYGASGARDDTWEYDGSSWSAATDPGPPARGQHAMAYDSDRRVVVLTGGRSAAVAAFADTWERGAGGWIDAAPSPAAPARYGHNLVYDQGYQRIVLLGGRDGFNSLPTQSVWTFAGGAWQLLSTTNNPSALVDARAVYDSDMSRIVLFGGVRSGFIADVLSGQTFTLDGSDWEAVVTSSPGPRSRMDMVFADQQGQSILFGGRSESDAHDDTWSFAQGSWTNLQPRNAPTARADHALAFRTASAEILLFGGLRPTLGAQRDTWTYDGTYWRHAEPASSPTPRFQHVLCYDAARDRVVLFGGSALIPAATRLVYGDTWEFDGADWREVTTATSPPRRRGAAAVYDHTRERIVLFGGLDDHSAGVGPPGPDAWYGDTWEYDGTDWREVTTASAPTARYQHALAFDAGRDRVVLFGGRLGAGGYDDQTWEFDGGDWRQVFPVSAPAPRAQHALVFDPARGTVLLFGGTDDATTFTQTWEYDGTTWRELFGLLGAPGRGRAAAATYDRIRRRLVLFGGGDPFGSETWEFTFAGGAPVEICDNRDATGLAQDDDDDGLANCADPDCNLDPRCAPVDRCRDTGQDRDGDGLLQCADPNCGGQPCNDFGGVCRAGRCFCPRGDEENCQNGTDDDCDGQVDCADADCAGAPGC